MNNKKINSDGSRGALDYDNDTTLDKSEEYRMDVVGQVNEVYYEETAVIAPFNNHPGGLKTAFSDEVGGGRGMDMARRSEDYSEILTNAIQSLESVRLLDDSNNNNDKRKDRNSRGQYDNQVGNNIDIFGKSVVVDADDSIQVRSLVVEGVDRSSAVERVVNNTPRSHIDYFLVVDFEATCIEFSDVHSFKSDGVNKRIFEYEIIEFPVLMINSVTLKVESEFHCYIKPTINPILSDFCMNLTGITQSVIDEQGITFEDAIQKLKEWMLKNNLDGDDTCTNTYVFVTDGIFDINRFIHYEYQRRGWVMDEMWTRYVDIKKLFTHNYVRHDFLDDFIYFSNNCHQTNEQPPIVQSSSNGNTNENENLMCNRVSIQNKKQINVNIIEMLKYFNMNFEGRLHSGIDDSRNIARILIQMLKHQKQYFDRYNDKVGTKNYSIKEKPKSKNKKKTRKKKYGYETDDGTFMVVHINQRYFHIDKVLSYGKKCKPRSS